MSRRACVICLVLIVKCYYLDSKNIHFDRLVGHSVWMRILKETDRLNKKKISQKCAFIFIALLLLHANLLGYAILWLFLVLLSYHLCTVAKCVYLQRVVIQVFRRQQFFLFCEREMRRVKCILRAESLTNTCFEISVKKKVNELIKV